jgi:acyl-coenzyme A thioesterase PaaI-like protein
MTAIQDLYPADFAHCYGCGRLNEHGLHIHTEWTGETGVARFRPRAEHVALPGFVYGGLLASLIDCHSIGTAAAAFMQAAGAKPGVDPSPRFVTGSLEVQFLKPTPMGVELVVTARPVEVGPRKVIVDCTIAAAGVDSARGRVVAVLAPASMTGSHAGRD